MTTDFTRELLVAALNAKRIGVRCDPNQAEALADAIREHGLESVIVPGVRPPLTFMQLHRKVFGGKG